MEHGTSMALLILDIGKHISKIWEKLISQDLDSNDHTRNSKLQEIHRSDHFLQIYEILQHRLHIQSESFDSDLVLAIMHDVDASRLLQLPILE